MSVGERTERLRQLVADALQRVATRIESGRKTEERVDHALVGKVSNGHPRRFETASVRLPLIAQRVVLRSDDDCGRDTLEIGRAKGRDPPAAAINPTARVPPHAPP